MAVRRDVERLWQSFLEPEFGVNIYYFNKVVNIFIQKGQNMLLPSGNQAWQWKIHHLWMIFPLKPPFTGTLDLPLPCLITRGYHVLIHNRINFFSEELRISPCQCAVSSIRMRSSRSYQGVDIARRCRDFAVSTCLKILLHVCIWEDMRGSWQSQLCRYINACVLLCIALIFEGAFHFATSC